MPLSDIPQTADPSLRPAPAKDAGKAKARGTSLPSFVRAGGMTARVFCRSLFSGDWLRVSVVGHTSNMQGRRNLRFASLLLLVPCALVLVDALYAQKAFQQYPSVEYGESTPLPPDWQRPGEWAFARLMYPPGPNDGYRGRFDGDWRQGMSLWTQDSPPADRSFAAAVRRLTRIDARSVEQDVNLDDGDEVYNWPWLYAVQVGEWGITQHQADVLRDYLLARRLLHGGRFSRRVRVADVRAAHPHGVSRPPDCRDSGQTIRSFTPLYDLDDRYQIPGADHLEARLQSAGLSAGARRREGRALVRHPRRQGPHHGRHLVQFGYWRFVGVVRPAAVSRAAFPISAFASA